MYTTTTLARWPESRGWGERSDWKLQNCGMFRGKGELNRAVRLPFAVTTSLQEGEKAKGEKWK
jgi:hypothetical protein